jgi:hypothetical protein
MYSSLILVSIGLGVITDSAERLLISFMLFVLLDKKASKEEEYLLELHPVIHCNVHYVSQLTHSFLKGV